MNGDLTRVVVVGLDGDAYEYWADRWIVDEQDEGRTLKLFAKDGYGAAARATRVVSLAQDFAKDERLRRERSE